MPSEYSPVFLVTLGFSGQLDVWLGRSDQFIDGIEAVREYHAVVDMLYLEKI